MIEKGIGYGVVEVIENPSDPAFPSIIYIFGSLNKSEAEAVLNEYKEIASDRADVTFHLQPIPFEMEYYEKEEP